MFPSALLGTGDVSALDTSIPLSGPWGWWDVFNRFIRPLIPRDISTFVIMGLQLIIDSLYIKVGE